MNITHAGQETIKIRQEITHTETQTRTSELDCRTGDKQADQGDNTKIRQTMTGDAEDRTEAGNEKGNRHESKRKPKTRT